MASRNSAGSTVASGSLRAEGLEGPHHRVVGTLLEPAHAGQRTVLTGCPPRLPRNGTIQRRFRPNKYKHQTYWPILYCLVEAQENDWADTGTRHGSVDNKKREERRSNLIEAPLCLLHADSHLFGVCDAGHSRLYPRQRRRRHAGAYRIPQNPMTCFLHRAGVPCGKPRSRRTCARPTASRSSARARSRWPRRSRRP